MTQVKLTILSNDAAEEGARPMIDVNSPDPDKWTNVGAIPLRKVRRLDVDEVLARSLPKLTVKVSRLSVNDVPPSIKE